MLKLLGIHALEKFTVLTPSSAADTRHENYKFAKTFPHAGGAVLQGLCKDWIYICGTSVWMLEGAQAKPND